VTSGVPADGLVVVDKPAGITSHDVVSRVRRLAGTRKVGHAGTLDPMATGVLVLGVNRATRLLGHLMLTEKGYDATIRLGVATTTDDAEGEVVSTSSTSGVTEAAVRAALAEFVGDIEQVPTAVSAIKVDGKRAYARVRDGETVELKARPVTIHELVVIGFETVAAQPHFETGPERALLSASPQPAVVDVRISVRCSSGTYIRAIARDLGAALGVGGHLTELRRTAVGPYTLGHARTLEQLGEEFELLPIAEAARAAFPAYELDAEQAQAVRYGRPLDIEADVVTGVFDPDGAFLALYEAKDGLARPVAVFVG
jgi:tRNA pseudouridine55 synthase